MPSYNGLLFGFGFGYIRKTVHEGKGLMSGASIDDMINEGCGEVVFGTCPIKIMEICANANGTLFFYSREHD